MSLALRALGVWYRVTAPVIPGFDFTPRLRTARTGRDLSRALAAFARRTGDAPVTVVGHSFGGWLAANLACHEPRVVRRLVLVAPAGIVAPRVGALQGAGGGPGAGGRPAPRPDAEGGRKNRKPEIIRRRNRRVGRQYLGQQWVDQRLVHAMGDLDVPTLVMYGSADAVLGEGFPDAVNSVNPSFRVVEVDGAGHVLEMDRPRRFVSEIHRFLSDADIDRRGRRRHAGNDR